MFTFHPIAFDWRVASEIIEPYATRSYRQILRGDPCSYCDKMSEACDHIISGWIADDDSWQNLTGACKSCNSRKSSKTVLALLSGMDIGDNQWHRERRRLAAWRASCAST